MKVGIIIPCSDVEDKISVSQFTDFINTETGYHLCFVNFGSKDNTLSLLHELENEVGDLVSILDVKRNILSFLTFVHLIKPTQQEQC